MNEKTLDARTREYNRQDEIFTARSDTTFQIGDNLREIIRQVVHEQLRRFLPFSTQPYLTSLADIVREEVQQDVGITPPNNAQRERQTMTFAAALGTPACRQDTNPL